LGTHQVIKLGTYADSKLTSKTIVYFASFIILGMAAAILGPTLPNLADRTGSLLSKISFLFTARSLGYLIGSLSSGRVFDRKPGHVLLFLSLVVMAIMFFMIPLITWLWIIVGIFFVLGIGEGFIDVGCDVMVVWAHKHKVSSYLNGLHFFFGFGALLIPIFVALTLMAFGDVFYSYWILGLLVLPIAGWVLFLPSPEPVNETRDLEQVKVNRIIVLMMSIFFVLYVGAEVSYGGWIFTYATSLGLGSGVSAAYLTSAFWGALTLGRLFMIPIAGRIRPMVVITIALAGCVVSLFLIFLNPSSVPILWIGTVALGLSMGPIFPTMIAFSEHRMALTGNIMRWFFVGAGLGGMFLPWLIGQLFETIGQDVTMYVILLDILFTIVVFFGVVLVSRPSRLKHIQTKTY